VTVWLRSPIRQFKISGNLSQVDKIYQPTSRRNIGGCTSGRHGTVRAQRIIAIRPLGLEYLGIS
jgi:hypothetical protein